MIYNKISRPAGSFGLTSFGLTKSILILWFSLFGFCSSAIAKWHEASTDHFVVYANQSPKTIKKFAERLERYHSAMNWFYQRTDTIPSPSNRLTIFVLGNKNRVVKLHGSGNRNIAGFYIPRAGSSAAYVPRINNSLKTSDSSAFILFHEYAHHFQSLMSSFAYPRWVSEGFAEFFASARFKADGGIGIGIPAYHRSYELSSTKPIPIEVLLDTKAYDKMRKEMSSWEHDSFYGQSWALFHMLQFSKERQGQFRRMEKLLASGTGELQASKLAFGDLDVLQKELNSYLKKRELQYLPVPASVLSAGDIKVRELEKGAAKVMLLRAEIQKGISTERAVELAGEVHTLTQKYPESIFLWETLVEVAVDAGLSEKAIAWADTLLDLDEDNLRANLYKALAVEQLIDSDGSDQYTWKRARRLFVRANHIEPDNPIPLIKYYLSHINANQKPTPKSILGLKRALRVAPYDIDLRWLVASRLATDGEYSNAITTLQPLANHPHKTGLAEAARKFIEEIKAASETEID